MCTFCPLTPRSSMSKLMHCLITRNHPKKYKRHIWRGEALNKLKKRQNNWIKTKATIDVLNGEKESSDLERKSSFYYLILSICFRFSSAVSFCCLKCAKKTLENTPSAWRTVSEKINRRITLEDGVVLTIIVITGVTTLCGDNIETTTVFCKLNV